jgi:hypothetical protein
VEERRQYDWKPDKFNFLETQSYCCATSCYKNIFVKFVCRPRIFLEVMSKHVEVHEGFCEVFP